MSEKSDSNGNQTSSTYAFSIVDPTSASHAHNDWRLQLLDPSLCHRYMRETSENGDEENVFSHIPWILTEEKDERSKELCHATATSSPRQNQQAPAAYPNIHYLDLRRLQNIQWADQRLHDGIKLATQQPQTHDAYAKARSAYQQGLDLVPDHVDLLVALGALQANHGKHSDALHNLQRALDLDPKHVNANAYLREVQAAADRQRQHRSLPSMGPSVKAARASLDASLEPSMLAEPGDNGAGFGMATSYDHQYPLLNDKDDDDYQSQYRRDRKRSRKAKTSKKSKGKKAKKSHRKHRKRRRSVGSDDDLSTSTSSSANSSESEERRRRLRKHRKRKHRRRDRKKNDDDDSHSILSKYDEQENGGRVLGSVNEETTSSFAVDSSAAFFVDRVPRSEDGDDGARYQSVVAGQVGPICGSNKSSPQSESTRDSLQLIRAQKLRRLVDRGEHINVSTESTTNIDVSGDARAKTP
ncbi:hypothetical protein MPSEU_000839700 [Mayamaea pseudoterrestris]|nr:hypothetical protein MPSEU_000839700 [Mayamaea pseudoterrestris]